MFLLGVMKLFLRSIVVLVASAYKLFLRKEVNFLPWSIACTQLKRVVKLCLTLPFCWGLPGMVNSNSIPSPSCLQAFLKAIFLPGLSQHRYCTCIFYLVFKFLTRPIITLSKSNFSFKKKLHA